MFDRTEVFFPGGSEKYFAFFPVKQGAAEESLQGFDLMADGRGRDAQLFSCLTETAQTSGCLEAAQTIEWWQVPDWNSSL